MTATNPEHEFIGPPNPLPIANELVQELIEPDRPTTALGREDPLSDKLYQAMLGNPEPVMTSLIDTVETYMIADDPGNELNDTQTYRLLCLMQDMPETIPASARLNIWRHLLQADWIYDYADPLQFARAITRQIKPGSIAQQICQIGYEVLGEITDDFESRFGFIDGLPRLDVIEFNMPEALDGQTKLQDMGNSAAEQRYGKMITLGMILSQVRQSLEAAGQSI